MPDQQKILGVDSQTGEITCSTCAAAGAEIAELRSERAAMADALDRREAEVSGLERDIRGWAYRYRELERDKEAEAKEHELFDVACDLFDLWRAAAGEAEGRAKPKKSKFSAERFFLILPMLAKDGVDLCRRAIIGRTFDHFTAPRKNGSIEHFHEFERIFKDRKEFESSANRAPADWEDRAARLDPNREDTDGSSDDAPTPERPSDG